MREQVANRQVSGRGYFQNRALPVAAGVSAFLLVGLAGTALPTRVAEFRIAVEFAIVVTLGWWTLTRLGRAGVAMVIPLFAPLVALAIVSLASRDVRGSTETVALATAFALLFLAVRDASRRAELRAAIAAGAFWAVTVWLLIIAAGWIAEKVIWVAVVGGAPPGDPFATFLWDSPNVPPFLTLLGIGCLPWLPRIGLTRIAVTAFWGASAVVVPLSMGRAAWLGIVAACVVYVATRRAEGTASPRWTTILIRRRRMVLAAGIALLVLALVLGFRSGAVEIRFIIWRQAATIFLADPLTGGGPSTFSWLRFEYLADYANPTDVEHAHNLVLQTLADGGLILFGATVVMTGAYIREAWRTRRHATNGHRLGYAVLVGFGLSSLLDHVAALNAIFALAVAIAAWSLPHREPEDVTSTRRRIALLAVPVILFSLSVPAVVSIAGARSEAAIARGEFRAGHFRQALAHFIRAEAWYPESAAYALGGGVALAKLGRLEEASDAFKRATILNPSDPRGWSSAASLAPSVDSAISYLRKAATQAHGDAQFSFRLAEALEKAGDTEDAEEQYAIAVLLRPSLLYEIDSPRLRARVVGRLPGTFDDLGARALISQPAFQSNIAIAAGELPSAAFPGTQAMFFAERGDAGAATAALDTAVGQDPHATATWAAYQAVGLLLCDEGVSHRGEIASSLLRERLRFAVVQWDPTYREDGLGDYQVTSVPGGPVHVPPLDMVASFPNCP